MRAMSSLVSAIFCSSFFDNKLSVHCLHVNIVITQQNGLTKTTSPEPNRGLYINQKRWGRVGNLQMEQAKFSVLAYVVEVRGVSTSANTFAQIVVVNEKDVPVKREFNSKLKTSTIKKSKKPYFDAR